MKLAIGLRALPLLAFSLFEMAVAFVRMIILTHILGPYEFGFASAISTAYATFELITDIAIYRFVFTSPRSTYSTALDAAHALALFRGVCVGSVVLLVSHPVACTLATCGNWPSFAWLAPVVIIKSFEHLEIRVAERDYRYWPQLIASLASHGCGLIALTYIAFKFENHYAFIAYLLAQSSVYVLASHLLASTQYRPNHRTPLVRQALVFGFPLALNGVGLALTMQGDRWIVGSLLGLQFLGLYAVVTLAAFVPIGGLFRVVGPILLAGMHNARTDTGEYNARLLLFSRALPAIAGVYALALIATFDALVSFAFGHQYAISDFAVLLVALIAFIRIIRSEPPTSLLLHTHNTRKLAIANQSCAIGLVATASLAIFHPALELILTGLLIGETTALCVVALMTYPLLKLVFSDYTVRVLGMLAVVVVAAVLTPQIEGHGGLATRLAITGGFLILIAVYAGFSFPGPYRKAYPSAAGP